MVIVLKIAVIDSGIDLDFKDFNNKKIDGINFSCNGNYNDFSDLNGHGTSCAGEIFRISPQAELYVIKVLNSNGNTSLDILIEALEHCLVRDDIRVINISSSCIIKDKKIIRVLNELSRRIYLKNKIIVSSNYNNRFNKVGYPSALKHVINVKFKYFPMEEEYFKLRLFNNECSYFGQFRLMPTIDGNYNFFKGNSSAAPRVSAYIYNLLKDKDIPNKILIRKLRQKTVNNFNYVKYNYDEKYIRDDIKGIIQNCLSDVIDYYNHIEGNVGREKIFQRLMPYMCNRLLREIELKLSVKFDYKYFTSEDFRSFQMLCSKILNMGEF